MSETCGLDVVVYLAGPRGDREGHVGTYVAQRETMLELATSAGLRWRSYLMVCVNCRVI